MVDGMNAEQLTELNCTPALDRIRAYGGLEADDTTDGQVQLIVDELDRTKVWDGRSSWSEEPPDPDPAGSTRPPPRSK